MWNLTVLFIYISQFEIALSLELVKNGNGRMGYNRSMLKIQFTSLDQKYDK